MESFWGRVGVFFVIIGVFLVILFLASDMAKAIDYGYLVGGGLLLLVGAGFIRRSQPPPSPEVRFKTARNVLAKLDRDQKKRQQKNKGKERSNR